jgi:hypothetical protein
MPRLPLALGLLVLALAAFGTGTARAECGEEENRDEVAFQSSGKLLVALCGPRQKAAVLRLDRAGRLDPSFAEDGSLGPWPSNFPPHLAVAPDGKLLVQMRLAKGGRRTVLRRFSAHGGLDRSFAAGNAPVPTAGTSPGQIRVFAQPQGTSVIAYYGEGFGCIGNDCAERTNYLQLYRYSATGKRVAEASYYTEYWTLRSVTMAPNGDLLVAGGNSEYSIATYLRTKPNLKPRAKHNFREGPFDPEIQRVVPAPEESFLASTNDGIQRYLPDWSTAAAFGEGGFVRCGSSESGFTALASLPSGGFLAADGTGRCGLMEFRADGLPESTFGSGGAIDLEALGLILPRYRLEAVAVGPEGEIAIAFRDEDRTLVRISRFSADGQLEVGFGSNGVVTVRNFGPA